MISRRKFLSRSATASVLSPTVRYFARWGARRFFEVAAGVWTCGLIRPAQAFTPPPNDTIYGQQWHLTKINAPAAWQISQGSLSTVIAVLDTGVTLGSESPAANTGFNEIDQNTSTPDWFTGGSGHGSMVTAVAMAATNNGAGSAGVCPLATLLPIVVTFTNGTVASNAAFLGIKWAADNGAHIINMSFVLGDTTSADIAGACAYAWSKGCSIVSGSGDSGVSDPGQLPASLPNVLGVGSTTSTDTLSTFSTTGCVKLMAPGGNSGATGANSICTTDKTVTSGCGVNGTSFSAPIVSGVLGLMRTANAKYTALRNDEMNMLIQRYGCDIVGGISGWPTLDASFGYGRINAAKAVGAAAGYARPFSVRSVILPGG